VSKTINDTTKKSMSTSIFRMKIKFLPNSIHNSGSSPASSLPTTISQFQYPSKQIIRGSQITSLVSSQCDLWGRL